MRCGKRIGFCMVLACLGLIVATWDIAVCQDSPPKRVFWIDSYDAGYAWSDGIEHGIRTGLKNHRVTFAGFHMNTKKCKTEACLRNAAAGAKAAVEAFDPDVLIASDDNAQKYLVVPYFKNKSMPVVFCGVNWDASPYGYPADNITGMIEVDLVTESIEHMRRHAAGDRIGYISGDTASDRKIIDWLNQRFFNKRMKAVRVNSYDAFKESFIALQREVDMLFIRNFAGIDGWDAMAAQRFIANHVRIPTGTNNDFMAPYVIFTLGKIPEEQGEYAAETALKILNGASPRDLAMVTNRRARLTVNLEMAKAANIVLPVSVLKVAKVIGRESYSHERVERERITKDYTGRRIAWIDSYHRGYEWSDGVEQGIREILFESGAQLTIMRMDTKRQKSEALIKAAAQRVKRQLDELNPDVIIASDDNAQKYLIVPYYRGSSLPVVFCGVNMDASMYGYPAANVTGMIETSVMKDVVALLKPFARGDRVGYLAGDVTTERKLTAILNQAHFGGSLKTYLVNSRAGFEKAFIKAQDEVDILFFSNYTGIADWDAEAAKEFVLRHSRIPSGSENWFMASFVACSLDKSAQEQGRHSALTALKILDGRSPADIPVVENKENNMTVNLQLAKKVGIVFPISILKQARVIGREIFE